MALTMHCNKIPFVVVENSEAYLDMQGRVNLVEVNVMITSL
jgi:hypothetical protein